ncbi:RING/U-box superfamily protein [Actinidia rufa]|uniref:RING/U-box superfamily protein n=1 Tax=Actinidia rufa TaxID=165716 RepID=A0A7J0E9D5_9ERIC|nr:RING/U-box superfamily protein [Actinidia rufa]
MEPSSGNSDAYRVSSSSSSSRRYGMHFSASNFFRSPLSTLLEYSGILRTTSSHPESDSLINSAGSVSFLDRMQNDSSVSGNGGEVSIRIIGAGEQDHDRVGTVLPSSTLGQLREANTHNDVYVQPMGRTASSTSVLSALDGQGDSRRDHGPGESVSQSLNGGGVDGEAADGDGANNRDSSYQRYDIQQAARWIEQVLPFSILLLVVFIRQHLQGFFVTIWIAAVMFKSNEILRKQTALKAQMLTLVEYLLLLYRALLPAPVWYRFFLNKEYGSLFSSLMTGLYLTFKLTSVVEKVQSFLASLKALSRKEIHYGAYATSEQVVQFPPC